MGKKNKQLTPKRPSWLTEPCPSWCDGDHTGQEMEADRTHWSEGISVPVVMLNRRADSRTGKVKREATGTNFTIALYKHVGESETWVFVGDDENRQRIEVTFENALRLMKTLQTQLLEMR